MKQQSQSPVVLWILQENQVTPSIIDFLTLLKSGLSKVEVIIAVPEQDKTALAALNGLDPVYFKLSRLDHGRTKENFLHKKEVIRGVKFSGGLEVWRALLIDDLGDGSIMETQIHMAPVRNLRGIILQIPTPLGSRAQEEHCFEAWAKWAHQNNVFIAGYELLPLYTRWQLLPSVLDGVITTNELSFSLLSEKKKAGGAKIWKLPRYEGNVFSMGPGNIWRTGLKAPYHYRLKHRIPKDKSILYIPHNVAMTYEYKELLRSLQTFGPDIHLMFSIGEDQVRGTHSHRDIIEITCRGSLDRFHSFSFHDVSAPWEMVMADAVAACAHGYHTLIAQCCGIPSIVWDETVPEAESGTLKIVSKKSGLKAFLADTLADHQKITDMAAIIYEIVNKEHPKQLQPHT